MKTRYFDPTNRTSLDSMMTPMIDVVFLLLVFFLTTSSFQRLEKLLPSSVSAESMSQAGGNSEQKPSEAASDVSDCVIQISRVGTELQYRFNDTPLPTLAALVQRMQAVIRVRPDVPIVVDPADAVTAGEALQIYDLAKGSGAAAVFMVAR
jgi:biopolymer transport protein ExbD